MLNLVSVCLETVLVSAQDRCTVALNVPLLRNHFGRTRWFSLVTRLKWKLVSVHLEIVLILTQDRCTVCAEHNIGLEIILTHPLQLLCDVGHLESCFGPFGDGVSVGARWVHGLRQNVP
jgi:hypothetical protein